MDIIYQIMNRDASLGYNITVLQHRSYGNRGAATSWAMVFYLGGESTFGFLGGPPLGNIVVGQCRRSRLSDRDSAQIGKPFIPVPDLKQQKNAGCRTHFSYSLCL